MRLLASLSQFTRNSKYIHAAGEAAEYMFSNYWYPESGVLHWGGHGYVDLVTGNRYGMKGVVHEIEDVYPYWELLRAVDADRGEMLMKGIWEANIKDWDALHYNRHGDFKSRSIILILGTDLGMDTKHPNQRRSLVYQCGTGSGLRRLQLGLPKAGGSTADLGRTPVKI